MRASVQRGLNLTLTLYLNSKVQKIAFACFRALRYGIHRHIHLQGNMTSYLLPVNWEKEKEAVPLKTKSWQSHQIVACGLAARLTFLLVTVRGSRVQILLPITRWICVHWSRIRLLRALYIANWFASYQLGFLIFACLFTEFNSVKYTVT